MNKYVKPEVEIVKFETEEIATLGEASGEILPTVPD